MNLKTLISFILLWVSLSVIPTAAYAGAMDETSPKIKLSGRIVGEDNMPIIGATLYVVGDESNGTITNMDGEFLLYALSSDKVTISFIGYKTQTLPAIKLVNAIITLVEESTALDEVVVVGFGTQKKVNLTGAVATVDSKVLQDRPVQNVSQALQGISPGLNISSNTGILDTAPSINIRGMTTIGEGSNGNPLVLIDGVEGDMNVLNPDDIATISVLKDASSAAIYGSRAAFGVILITTKKGNISSPVVNYKNSLRWSSPLGLQHQADSYSWALFMNDADLTGNYFPNEQLERLLAYQHGELTTPKVVTADGKWQGVWYNGSHANVDWGTEIYKDWTFSQEHQGSISGGNEKMNYYASVDYLDMDGMLKFGTDSYNRIALNGKINAKFNLWEFTYSTRFSRTNSKKPSNYTDSDYANIMRQQWPMFPICDNNGHLDAESRAYEYELNKDANRSQKNTIVQHMAIAFTPFNDIRLTGEVSYVGNHDNYHQHQNRSYIYNPDETINEFGTDNSYVAEQYYHSDRMTYSLYGNYNYTWLECHFLNATLGFQAENLREKQNKMKRLGLMIPGFTNIDNTTGLDGSGAAVEPEIAGYEDKWATSGFFGRLGYDYKGRYLVEVNARYDGSSRFRSDRRWVWSPSVSIGWNLAQEKFWESLTPYINQFKVRGSYGSLANQNTKNYYPTYSVMPININAGQWLVNGSKPTTSNSPTLVSSLLTWETVETLDIGFDLGAFNNRLSATFDWYNRDTKDMIGPAPVMPSSLGTAVPKLNNTSLRTRGWEISLSWRDRIKDFNYCATFSLSDDHTEITDYPATIRDITKDSNYFTGKVIGDIYGYSTVGIAKTDKEMKNHLVSLPNGGQSALGSGWSAGDIMYEDINGDGKVDYGDGTLDNPGDLIKIGNKQPRYRIGIGLSASWKGFDFNAFFQGVLKQDFSPGPDNATFFGAVGGSIWWSQCLEQHLDYFRNDPEHPLGENLNAYYARPVFQDNKKNQQHQTHYVQSAAYLRCKNLQLGYTLPNNFTQKFFIKNFRIYLSAENLFTITSLTDIYDPETMWGGSYGTVYPLSKTFSFGLSANF